MAKKLPKPFSRPSVDLERHGKTWKTIPAKDVEPGFNVADIGLIEFVDSRKTLDDLHGHPARVNRGVERSSVVDDGGLDAAGELVATETTRDVRRGQSGFVGSVLLRVPQLLTEGEDPDQHRDEEERDDQHADRNGAGGLAELMVTFEEWVVPIVSRAPAVAYLGKRS